MGCSIGKKRKLNSTSISLTEFTTIQKQCKERKLDRIFFPNKVPILSSINESSIILRRRFSEKPTLMEVQKSKKHLN